MKSDDVDYLTKMMFLVMSLGRTYFQEKYNLTISKLI
jgi:hypothetical protein